MLYHRNVNPRLADLGRPLVVFAQTTAAAQPGEGSLDNPAFRHDDELLLRPFDDFQEPQPVSEDPVHQSGVGVDAVGIHNLHATNLWPILLNTSRAPS